MKIDLNELEEKLSSLMEQGSFRSIITVTDAAFDDPDTQQLALYYRIRALTNDGRADEAIEVAEDAVKIFDASGLHHAAAWAYLGSARVDGKERTLKARDHLIKAILLAPDEPQYFRDLGEIYLINRESQKAATYLAHALCREPENPDYLSRFGLALLRCGYKDEALYFAAIALELLDDFDGDALDTCGMVALLAGNFDEAEALFNRAVEVRPEYQYFQSHLDWLERERRDCSFKKNYIPLYIRQKQRNRYFDEKDEPAMPIPGVSLDRPLPLDFLTRLYHVDGDGEILD